MLYLGFREGALGYWKSLPLWQRERLAETILNLLMDNPRPYEARPIGPPESYRLPFADRDLMYRIHKDDQGADRLIVIFHV